jgi:hypothetical protein
VNHQDIDASIASDPVDGEYAFVKSETRAFAHNKFGDGRCKCRWLTADFKPLTYSLLGRFSAQLPIVVADPENPQDPPGRKPTPGMPEQLRQVD